MSGRQCNSMTSAVLLTKKIIFNFEIKFYDSVMTGHFIYGLVLIISLLDQSQEQHCAEFSSEDVWTANRLFKL